MARPKHNVRVTTEGAVVFVDDRERPTVWMSPAVYDALRRRHNPDLPTLEELGFVVLPDRMLN